MSLLLLTQLIFKSWDAQSTINTLRKEEIFINSVLDLIPNIDKRS